MKKNLLSILILLLAVNVFAQRRANAEYQEVKNRDVVNSVFPTAQKIEKENTFWFRILDTSGSLLGYAMNSVPYCKDVIGYNDVTPVMIITDKKLKVMKVQLLSNWETPSYIQRLETKGFFKLWNGKTIKQAKSVQMDAYTGATITARSVDKNVQFLVDNGLKNLPKKN